MLIIVFLFVLFGHLRGTPLTACLIKIPEHAVEENVVPRSLTLGTRGTSDIVISCLATIFACTWTAIHPNIPSPTDSRWDIFKRRLITTFYALLAPEAITTWALRQKLAAQRIAKKYNEDFVTSAPEAEEDVSLNKSPEPLNGAIPKIPSLATRILKDLKAWIIRIYRRFFDRPSVPEERRPGEVLEWTTAHGFWLQMGGFMLSRNGKPLRTLRHYSPELEYNIKDAYADIFSLLSNKNIEPISITKTYMEDRSTGDVISKTIAILQTTWFFAQCVARWSVNLPVTELEIITLGFVMLNAITYAFWWDKPQNVGVPIYLEWIPTELDPTGPTEATRLTKKSFIARQISKARSTSSNPIVFVASIAFALIIMPFQPPLLLLTGQTFFPLELDLRVPMFDSSYPGSDSISLPMTVIAVLFGTVHLIPAFFIDFPSSMDRRLWRVSAIITTALPPIIVFPVAVFHKIPRTWLNHYIIIIFLVIISFCYIAARIILITLAFGGLRDLPAGAFDTIDWLSAIPHL